MPLPIASAPVAGQPILLENKYLRTIRDSAGREAQVDVYDVLLAFDVRCPARQHAIKKLLCTGLRGKGGVVQDLDEASAAVERSVVLAGGTSSHAKLQHHLSDRCAQAENAIALSRRALLAALGMKDTGQDLVPLVRQMVARFAMSVVPGTNRPAANKEN